MHHCMFMDFTNANRFTSSHLLICLDLETTPSKCNLNRKAGFNSFWPFVKETHYCAFFADHNDAEPNNTEYNVHKTTANTNLFLNNKMLATFRHSIECVVGTGKYKKTLRGVYLKD